jgi:hypothetical protein
MVGQQEDHVQLDMDSSSLFNQGSLQVSLDDDNLVNTPLRGTINLIIYKCSYEHFKFS